MAIRIRQLDEGLISVDKFIDNRWIERSIEISGLDTIKTLIPLLEKAVNEVIDAK